MEAGHGYGLQCAHLHRLEEMVNGPEPRHQAIARAPGDADSQGRQAGKRGGAGIDAEHLEDEILHHPRGVPPVDGGAQHHGAAAEESIAQVLEGGILVLALQRLHALPRQAVLARLDHMVCHLDQLDLGAGLRCPLQRRSHHLIGPALAVGATHKPQDAPISCHAHAPLEAGDATWSAGPSRSWPTRPSVRPPG